MVSLGAFVMLLTPPGGKPDVIPLSSDIGGFTQLHTINEREFRPKSF